jgi:hypothetical protein
MPDATTHVLHAYLDARVRKDRAPAGFAGTLAVGIKSVRGTAWWICEARAGQAAATRFASARPATCDVAVGLDDAGADQLLGRIPRRRPLRLVAGDAALLKRFVGRYLKDASPLSVRLGASR